MNGVRGLDLRKELNRQNVDIAQGTFAHGEFDVPQFSPMELKNGGPVPAPGQAMKARLAKKGGPIKGPGGPKSDSIDAQLPVKSFVLPAEVVAAIGPDKLQAIIESVESESPAEDRAEGGMEEAVPAKVSNGEFLVPPHVVAATGPEYWQEMIASVTGGQAAPEMGPEGAVHAAGGYGADDDFEKVAKNYRQQSTDLRSKIDANVAQIPQVQNANRAAEQTQALRQKIDTNLAQPAVTPSQPPSPQQMADNAAQQTQVLRQRIDTNVAQSPAVQAQNRAVQQTQDLRTKIDANVAQQPPGANLKQRLAANPNAQQAQQFRARPAPETIAPEQTAANYQQQTQAFRQKIDANLAQPQPQAEPAPGANLRQRLSNNAGAQQAQTFAEKTAANRAANTVEPTPSYNRVGEAMGQSAQGDIVPRPNAAPVDQWTGKTRGAGVGQKLRSLGNGIRSFVTDPTVLYQAADTANQALLERGVRNDDSINYNTAMRLPLSLANRIPQAIEAATGSDNPSLLSRGIDAVGNAATDIYANAVATKAQRNGAGQPVPAQGRPGAQQPAPSPNASSAQQRDQSDPQAEAVQVPVDVTGQTIVPSAGYANNGLRNDGSAQTLDWNEQRFDNSGDPAQDAALEARRGVRGLMQYQKSLSTPETRSEFTRGKHGTSGAFAQGGFKPDIPNLPGAQETDNKTIYKPDDEGNLIPVSGPGADALAANQQQMKAEKEIVDRYLADPEAKGTDAKHTAIVMKWLKSPEGIAYLKSRQSG